MNLEQLGWNDNFSREFEKYKKDGLSPARVVREDRERYHIVSAEGDLTAEITGKIRHSAESRSDFPAVGDWVAISSFPNDGQAVIHAVLPRKSSFVRKSAGFKTSEQIVAANVDFVFLVLGLDLDFNLRRLERYLTSAWDSGANPVIVLNKADLCDSTEEKKVETEKIAAGIPVLVMSEKN